jgi:hypothetical protein
MQLRSGLRMRRARWWPTAMLVAALSMPALPALAIEDRADVEPNHPVTLDKPVAWKASLGLWRDSDAGSAHDLNLRANTQSDAFWVGFYRDRDHYQQARAGWEHQFDMRFGRLIASGQLASGGFAGGSLTAEIHPDPIDPYALLVGWGRTNLQNYFNLNFDPNDSWLLGASWKPDDRTAVTLFQIRDDRLDTRQRVTHLVARMPGTAGYTWSVDLFHRAGWASAIPDGSPVHRWGLSASLEHGALFTKLAWDPRANFGPTSMLRWSVGMRF